MAITITKYNETWRLEVNEVFEFPKYVELEKALKYFLETKVKKADLRKKK